MFTKKNRLTTANEIDQVFKKGKSSFGNNLGIKILPNDFGYLRLTVLVSTKVSKKAIERNLLKRRIKAILKKELTVKEQGTDMVVLTKPGVKEFDFSNLETEIKKQLKKLKII